MVWAVSPPTTHGVYSPLKLSHELTPVRTSADGKTLLDRAAYFSSISTNARGVAKCHLH
jgi:hypothetical protein